MLEAELEDMFEIESDKEEEIEEAESVVEAIEDLVGDLEDCLDDSEDVKEDYEVRRVAFPVPQKNNLDNYV